MKALERQALLADRAAVTAMLARIPAGDVVGRLSFQARLEEIESQLQKLEGQNDQTGSVALIFSGQPVIGSRAIDAAFVSDALRTFQDMVTRRIAGEELGELGGRGPVPVRTPAGLSVTNMIRGSVGFLLEEQPVNAALADTAVKQAIDDVTNLVERTASEQEDLFDAAIQDLEPRLLVSLRTFFKTLDEGQAELRIVEGEHDSRLDSTSIHRARTRLETTRIDDREDDTMVGELLGVVPNLRRFEMRLPDGREIRGTVSAKLSTQYLELIERPGAVPIGRWWRVKMKIREVTEPNKPPRQLYTLLGLIEEHRAAAG